jgi:hypothetical protein
MLSIFYTKNQKMKNQIFTALLCSVLFAVSCKKNNSESPADLSEVFVAGTETDNVSGKEIATVWKNGVISTQITSNNHTYARAVCAVGSDVYTTGYEYDVVWKWKVWKNGAVLYTINDGEPTDAHAIAVSGSDVYTAGHFYSPGTLKHYAVAFKNDQLLYMLTDGNQQAEATGIAVSGNDVYITGYYGNETKLWKNGVLVPLNNASGYRGTAVTIKGSDIYVLGNGQSFPLKIRVWKNGVSTDIASGSGDALGKSIAVADNNDVYIAGQELLNGKWAARLWENGTATTLNDGTKFAYANAVTVKGNDVYVAGIEKDANNTLEYARVWKNGAAAFSNTSRSKAFGIFVK